MTRSLSCLVLFGSLVGLAGCTLPPVEASRPLLGTLADDLPDPNPCGRKASSPRIAPASTQGTSGVVATAYAGDRTLALIADADARAVRVVDVDRLEEVGSYEVHGTPSSILVTKDGRVLVTVADEARLDVLEPREDLNKGFDLRCSVNVPNEPVATATSPDEARLFVASRWSHALTELSMAGLFEQRVIDLPRDPTAVVVTEDGARAFVTHATLAHATEVDLATNDARVRDLTQKRHRHIEFLSMEGPRGPSGRSAREEVRTVTPEQAFALVRAGDRVLVPDVLADTGNGSRTEGYGDRVAVFAHVTELSTGTTAADRVREARTEVSGPRACLLPRAASFDEKSERLLVACEGLDQVIAYDVKRGSTEEHEVLRVATKKGTVGLAIDPRARRGIAFSLFDRAISIFELDARGERKPEAELVLDRRAAPLEASIARGRALFHDTGHIRISFDGRACASCHLDGRDDGLSWTTEDGPRQTPILLGRLEGTAPYGWDGANKTIDEHMHRTLTRLGGTGITTQDQADLASYIGSLRPPVKRSTEGALAARGDALFHDEATGCSTCHLGDDALTDGLRHDVKSRKQGDVVKEFDTPSLRFLAASAPYFHDGRYASIDEVLERTDGAMGHTKELGADDKKALAAYLSSL